MSQLPRNVVVGVFANPARARDAVAELQRLGFREDQLGVMSREDVVASADVRYEGTLTNMEEGAAAGALTGLGIGLGLMWGLGVTMAAIPGLAIAGGLLVALFGGAALGTVIGALVGLGVPEDEAQWYENEVHAGQVVVTVRSVDRYNEAFAVLRRWGAYDVASGRPPLADAVAPSVRLEARAAATVPPDAERDHGFFPDA